MAKYKYKVGDIIWIRTLQREGRIIEIFRGARYSYVVQYYKAGNIYTDCFSYSLIEPSKIQDVLAKKSKRQTSTNQPTEKENTMSDSTLYQVKGKNQYGTRLTTDSKGRYVLEMKGKNGEIKAFKPSELEEVKPNYVCFRSASSSTGVYMECAEDVFDEGDVVMFEGSRVFYMVTKTKCSRGEGSMIDHVKQRKMRRLKKEMFEEIVLGDDDDKE